MKILNYLNSKFFIRLFLILIAVVMCQKIFGVAYITDINARNNVLSLATYSKYYVVSSLNASPAHGELNYRTSDNKLFKYNAVTQTRTEIDWVNAVKATQLILHLQFPTFYIVMVAQ